MAELKTKVNDASVEKFLNSIKDDNRRKDCFTILGLMKSATKVEPKMWGTSIVGFGSYHYKYASGREGDWFKIGFAPRKTNLTIYIICGFHVYEKLMKKLGKYKGGKSCLYIKSLDDVDLKVLKKIFETVAKHPDKQ